MSSTMTDDGPDESKQTPFGFPMINMENNLKTVEKWTYLS